MKPLQRLVTAKAVTELYRSFSVPVAKRIPIDFQSIEEDGWFIRYTDATTKSGTEGYYVVMKDVYVSTTVENAEGKDMGEVAYSLLRHRLYATMERFREG